MSHDVRVLKSQCRVHIVYVSDTDTRYLPISIGHTKVISDFYEFKILHYKTMLAFKKSYNWCHGHVPFHQRVIYYLKQILKVLLTKNDRPQISYKV